MSNIQYSREEEKIQSPAEQLVYLSSATYGPDWISLFHSHSFAEIFYVVDGEGSFCTDDRQVPLKKNSMVAVNPHVRHTEKSSHSHPLTYVVLGIDNLQFTMEDEDGGFRLFDLSKHAQEILPLLHLMEWELKEKKDYFQPISDHYLAAFLLKFHQITGHMYSSLPHQDAPDECALVKRYMDAHYQESITLDYLAKLAHLNKYYLAHMFTEAYGISPIGYLLERRILHSKELLRNTSYSITQIAHMTGFSSQNYFSQSFKKYTGDTAKSYRNRHGL